MTQSTDPAAPTPGAAAVGETDDTPKTVEWRGLQFTLPPVLPGELIFDFADLEDAEGTGPIVRLLRSMLGDQVAKVRKKIAEDEVPLAEADGVLSDLISTVFDAYGVSAGESEASPSS